MRKPKFRVYLAGPISGCNDAQMRRWRESVKEKYNKHFDFIDPVVNLLDGEANAHAVVEADIRSIESADGLLIYNPANQQSFSLSDWRLVADAVRSNADELGFSALSDWAAQQAANDSPGKGEQDCLDSAICLLVALQWRRLPRHRTSSAGRPQRGGVRGGNADLDLTQP